jgi:transposase InsO family protein
MSWRTFVRSHAHLIAAADFVTTEVWTVRGWVRHFTLFVLDIATRRVHTAAVTERPTSEWMEQMARNLTGCDEGFLNGKRYLVIDRDAIFSPKFKTILRDSGVGILLTAYEAPNMNAYAERFVRSIKSECLERMVFLGRESLVPAIAEYAAHYHDERSHQGIGNVLINGAVAQRQGDVKVHERLGGLLKYYHREATQPNRLFGHCGRRT